MPKVTIDGIDYDTEGMSDDAKIQLKNVLYCDQKLSDIKNETAVLQTARNAYAQNLAQILSGGGDDG